MLTSALDVAVDSVEYHGLVQTNYYCNISIIDGEQFMVENL
jgi:hypothetical protein